MSKVWTSVLLLLCLIFVVFVYKEKTKTNELENILSNTSFQLSNHFDVLLDDYLFDSAIKTPTTENIKALYYGVTIQRHQIETLINLNQSNINTSTWNEYLRARARDPFIFLLNSSPNDSGNLEKIKQLKEKWNILQSYLKMDMSSDKVTNPTSFTASYISFLLDKKNE